MSPHCELLEDGRRCAPLLSRLAQGGRVIILLTEEAGDFQNTPPWIGGLVGAGRIALSPLMGTAFCW